MVERHLAKVNVASSNLVFRSKKGTSSACSFFVHFFKENISELLIMSRKRGIMELSYIISIKSIYYRKYKCCGSVSFLSLQKTKAV